MTEKRFEIRQEDIDCDYLDLEGLISCIKCDGEFITYAEILNLLNELNDENKQLKQVINDYGSSDVSSCMNTIFKLAKENEQLKQENKTLADALTVYFKSKTIEPNYDAH